MSKTALHCSAFTLLFMEKALAYDMIETKFPKFQWGEVSENNAGHTKHEWGTKPKVIIAYRVNWKD